MIEYDASNFGAAVAASLTIPLNPASPTDVRGVVQLVHLPLIATNEIVSVTYGGVALSHLLSVTKATGEPMGIHAYARGDSMPQGQRDAVITLTGTQAVASLVTSLKALSDVALVNLASFSGDAVTDPSVALALLSRPSFVALGFCTGHEDTANFAPLANWTNRFEGGPLGTACVGAYTYNPIAAADVTAGFTQAAEDVVGIALAMTESSAVLFATRRSVRTQRGDTRGYRAPDQRLVRAA